MNCDRVQGIWKQLKGAMRVGWGKLTNDQLAAIAGRCEIHAGRLQEAYGIGKEEAARLGGVWRGVTDRTEHLRSLGAPPGERGGGL